MAFEIDGDGRLDPGGRLHIHKETDFTTGALPDWLVLGDGTQLSTDAGSSVTYTSAETAVPTVDMASASGASKVATLYGPKMLLSVPRAARMGVTFYGGQSLAAETCVAFGFVGTNAEARVLHRTDSSTAKVWTKDDTGTRTETDTPFRVYAGAWHTMWVTVTNDNCFYWGRQGADSVDFAREFTTADLDVSHEAVWPFVRTFLSAAGSSPAELSVAKFELDIWYQ